MQDDSDLKIQTIESTCPFSKVLNKNNSIDCTHIIYLSGSSIVFHNIFQNNKKFITRISDNPVIGMAFFKSSENVVGLVTHSQNQVSSLSVQIYVLGQQGSLMAQILSTSGCIDFLDMEFLDKRRAVLLTKEAESQFFFYVLELGKKPRKKIAKIQSPKRFVSQDRHIYVCGSKGLKQFDTEFQDLMSEVRFENISISDYAVIDTQFEIVLSENKILSFHDGELQDEFLLDDFSEKNLMNNDSWLSTQNSRVEASSIIRVGRNLLVAHRNSITLSHFVIEGNNLKFLTNFHYRERIKGGILSMQVSFDEMHLALSVEIQEKGQMRIENFMFNLSILSSQKKFINPFIRLISLGAESGEVKSLQGVIAFETYHLVGNTVVNYNFNEQVEKKFKFCLHETPKQMAVHPLGHQFVCIFDQQIKFYVKIESQLTEICKEQLSCSAIKYTNCGSLLMALVEDSFYQLVEYDTNCFKRIRNIPSVYIKNPVNRIELAEQDSQAILYFGNDFSIYKLKNGEKLAEYKSSRDKAKDETLALAYDPDSLTLLASTSNGKLLYNKKIDEIGWEFDYQRVLEMPEDIMSIQISQPLDVVFLGTKNGKLLWCEYPLNIIQTNDLKYTVEWREMKLGSEPIINIFATNNLKYLFVGFMGEGLIINRLRKIIKYRANNRFNEFDISNLNFLQTSSKHSLEGGYQKLKALLEKRKAVFNDLQEYKKQWEIKKSQKLRNLDTENKHKELQHVNCALEYVEQLKAEKKRCHQKLESLDRQTQEFLKSQEQNYEKDILLYYDENVKLRTKKQRIGMKCENEYLDIERKCEVNINEINSELLSKYTVFLENYQEMKGNLSLYQQRLQIQRQQAQAVLQQLFENKLRKLNQEEVDENRKSNELKALITRYKKEAERYISRRYFLESKKNFFVEELSFCRAERDELIEVRRELEEELLELEVRTNKKEKRLRKYFKENDVLTKYQAIHTNLVEDLEGEVKFVTEQKEKAAKDIVSIQKELSEVAQLNESYEDKLNNYSRELTKFKQREHECAEKNRYLKHMVEEMSTAIEKIKVDLNDTNKAALFGQIYREFYITRKLQNVIQSSQTVDPVKTESDIEAKIFDSIGNKKKVRENLKQHKEYLDQNMRLFERHNQKSDSEMNLNFLKYQTQNYNLIAECNVRKEQTNKKKRILHELIDSVKETQMYMNELQKENFDHAKLEKVEPAKQSRSIPFLQYKKHREEMEKSRLKVVRPEDAESTFWKSGASTSVTNKKSVYHVRRMLEVQKINSRPASSNVTRNIRTANVRNKDRKSDNTLHVEVINDEFVCPVASSKDLTRMRKKPMTANGKRHQIPFGQYYQYNGFKNKSTSKPTTCTTHTHNHRYLRGKNGESCDKSDSDYDKLIVRVGK